MKPENQALLVILVGGSLLRCGFAEARKDFPKETQRRIPWARR